MRPIACPGTAYRLRKVFAFLNGWERKNPTGIEFHDTWKLHEIQVSSSISKLLVHRPAHTLSTALLPHPHPHPLRKVTATATFALRGQRRVAVKRLSGPQGPKYLLSPPKTCRPSSEKGVVVPAGAQGSAGRALGSRGGGEGACRRAVGSGLGPCLTQGPHARLTITAMSQESLKLRTPQTQPGHGDRREGPAGDPVPLWKEDEVFPGEGTSLVTWAAWRSGAPARHWGGSSPQLLTLVRTLTRLRPHPAARHS